MATQEDVTRINKLIYNILQTMEPLDETSQALRSKRESLSFLRLQHRAVMSKLKDTGISGEKKDER
jgi:hypothetical protein